MYFEFFEGLYPPLHYHIDLIVIFKNGIQYAHVSRLLGLILRDVYWLRLRRRCCRLGFKDLLLTMALLILLSYFRNSVLQIFLVWRRIQFPGELVGVR